MGGVGEYCIRILMRPSFCMCDHLSACSLISSVQDRDLDSRLTGGTASSEFSLQPNLRHASIYNCDWIISQVPGSLNNQKNSEGWYNRKKTRTKFDRGTGAWGKEDEGAITEPSIYHPQCTRQNGLFDFKKLRSFEDIPIKFPLPWKGRKPL